MINTQTWRKRYHFIGFSNTMSKRFVVGNFLTIRVLYTEHKKNVSFFISSLILFHGNPIVMERQSHFKRQNYKNWPMWD